MTSKRRFTSTLWLTGLVRTRSYVPRPGAIVGGESGPSSQGLTGLRGRCQSVLPIHSGSKLVADARYVNENSPHFWRPFYVQLTNGASDRSRTDDRRFTKPLLYL